MNSTLRLASTLAVCTALLIGCGSSQQNERADGANSGSDQRNRGAQTQGGENLASAGSGNCAIQAVYFDYDSSNLDERSRRTLDGDAQCLQQRGAGARVTGMTDPRGTEEYNLALGEGRARSVARYLTMVGVEEQRVSIHSVGEESATGIDESGWSRDRRAEIETR